MFGPVGGSAGQRRSQGLGFGPPALATLNTSDTWEGAQLLGFGRWSDDGVRDIHDSLGENDHPNHQQHSNPAIWETVPHRNCHFLDWDSLQHQTVEQMKLVGRWQVRQDQRVSVALGEQAQDTLAPPDGRGRRWGGRRWRRPRWPPARVRILSGWRPPPAAGAGLWGGRQGPPCPCVAAGGSQSPSHYPGRGGGRVRLWRQGPPVDPLGGGGVPREGGNLPPGSGG